MDFSRLHLYSPPQCAPENTGYTYALSSSYSSDALDFETEHKLDPVFESPRMSRRSLRLVSAAYPPEGSQAVDADACAQSAAACKDRAARTAKQRSSTGKRAFTINHMSRKVTSSVVSQDSCCSLQGSTSLRPPVLDESLIREQTKVDHFWGLDDDSDLKGGSKAVTQGMASTPQEEQRWPRSMATPATPAACSLSAGPSSRRAPPPMDHPQGFIPGTGLRNLASGSAGETFGEDGCLRASGGAGAESGLCCVLVAGDRMVPAGHFDFLAERAPSYQVPSKYLQVFILAHPTVTFTKCHGHDEQLQALAASLERLQAQMQQADGSSEGVLSLVRAAVEQRLQEAGAGRLLCSQTDFTTFHQEHEARIANLEDILGKLTEKSEIIQKELEQTKLRTMSRGHLSTPHPVSQGVAEDQDLLAMVELLQLDLGHLKSEMSSWQNLKTSCEKVDRIHEKVDTQVRETIKLMFSDDRQQDGSLEWLLQRFSSQFVSKEDLHILLRDLELQILKNISHHISVTKQMPTSETVVSAMSEAGASGITEAQALVLVNNALKLYSQDKTGMVDFALESGGGSILSTRCSETYETRTALISLFGIPLWYFSQSPRVVIQPDIYPGNCWAFKGSQGYLVVRLSMAIFPTTFTLEHVPRALSPPGSIASAPRDFTVHGLENEYQEEGLLLGQFTYDQDGESLQMFHVLKRPEKAFQIVELQISSNWGHPEYTCLYRFRVHGEPVK